MGVLVLMLVLAGQVFTLTVQSTGQATALVDLNQSIRAFERQIRDDLAHVYPGESLMAIQCNPVNAYWTPEGRQADADNSATDGYAHNADPEREAFDLTTLTPVLDSDGRPILTLPRADMLMMFTAKRSRSYVAPEVQSNMQEVVYGHAILGEYVADPNHPGQFKFESAAGSAPTSGSTPTSGSDPMFPEPTINQALPPALLPASSWHLARREVHLIPSYVKSLVDDGKALDWEGRDKDNKWVFGPATSPDVGPGLSHDDLLTGAIDIVVNFDYTSMVKQIDERLLNVGPVANSDKKGNGWMLPWVFGRNGRERNPMARSELDTTPPPTLANRLGSYMLPNCASFKVEFSLNPKSDFVAGRLDGVNEILWIDLGHTEDPIGLVDVANDDALSAIQQKIDRLQVEINNSPKPLADRLTLEQQRLQALLESVETRADGAAYSLWQRFRGPGYHTPPPPPPSGFGEADAWPSLTDALKQASTNRANTQVFAATRPVDTNLDGKIDASELDNVVPDPVFPSAIRITIDVFDPQRRLGHPTRHVIIAQVGG